MLKLIKFIYTDEVEDVDFDLLLAADHFKIPRLFATCEFKLCEFENEYSVGCCIPKLIKTTLLLFRVSSDLDLSDSMDIRSYHKTETRYLADKAGP